MPDSALTAEISAWLTGRLPAEWFDGVPDVTADRDEILVVGTMPGVAGDERDRIERFREGTREQRVRIARDAERRWDRKVSWGLRCGEHTVLFTVLSIPAMTRLRLPERRVLDTLVAAGVARSRSDALAWCVRLVGANEERWLADLRDAFAHVARVRAAGPEERATEPARGRAGEGQHRPAAGDPDA